MLPMAATLSNVGPAVGRPDPLTSFRCSPWSPHIQVWDLQKEFKGHCLRQSSRTDHPTGDDMLTFTHLKSVTYLEVWSTDDMFTKCFLGVEDVLDWSVSLASSPLDIPSVSNNPRVACSVAGVLLYCRGPVPVDVVPTLPMAATLSNVGPAGGRPDEG